MLLSAKNVFSYVRFNENKCRKLEMNHNLVFVQLSLFANNSQMGLSCEQCVQWKLLSLLVKNGT